VSQGHRGYYVIDGVLYHELVVPTQSRKPDAPYAGHFSAKKMYDKVSQYYF